MEAAHPSLTLALALAAGVLCQSVARYLRIPGIVLLLAAGFLLGSDGLGWIRPEQLGGGLFAVVHVAVAVVLFEGGLNLEISRLRRSQMAIRRLVTAGALVTLTGGMVAALVLLRWEVWQALLFGSLVVVTGPTVVGPLISELRLRPKVATVLEAEGVIIDPIGALLAVLALQIAISPAAATLASGTLDVLGRLGFGTAAGLAAGGVLALLLRSRWVPEGFENIASLAVVLVLFEGCEALLSESGILAVTLAGAVVGNVETRVHRDLREFKDQLSVLLIGLLFVLLAADVRYADIRALGWPGLAVVGVLIAVVRPINAWVSTKGSDLSTRERLFIGWIAPRGIVAAAVASITAVALDSHGLAGGRELRALVFLTITGTVIVAGLSARPLAHVLKLRLPGRDTVAILGAEGLGIALARELVDAGQPVVLLDSNPQNCRMAEEAGLPVVFGNALEERVLQRARFPSVGTAVGMTANEALNGMFVSRSRELFDVPRGYVALLRSDSGVTPEILARQDSNLLFEMSHDVERWNVRARHNEMLVERFTRKEAEPTDDLTELSAAEKLLFLTAQRGGRCVPMSADFIPRPGDVVAIALHAPEAPELREALRDHGWLPVEQEEGGN